MHESGDLGFVRWRVKWLALNVKTVEQRSEGTVPAALREIGTQRGIDAARQALAVGLELSDQICVEAHRHLALGGGC